MTDEDSPITEWVDEFLENERSIKRFLKDISSSRIDNASKIRERIRSFAGDSRYPKAFLAVYFAISKDENYLDDVEDSFSTAAADKLREIAEEYSELQGEFWAVYEEEYLTKHNPVSDQSANVVALTGQDNIPIVGYNAYSGDTLVFKSNDTISEHFTHAAAMVHYNSRILADNKERMPIEELQEIKEARVHIEKHLLEIDEMLDSVEELEEVNMEDIHSDE